MASALVIGTVASCVLTELIRVVIETTKTVKKCKPECKKLEKELDAIKPDVERLERRLQSLRTRASNIEQEDIKMVEDWLGRLKDALEVANIEVHSCTSRRILFDRKVLSEKITSTYNEISKIAADRVSLYLQLGRLMEKESSQHGANGSYYYGYGFPDSNSGHLVSQDSNSGHLVSQDSNSSGSSHFWGGSGDDSSSGYESSGAAMLRRMSQERNGILQQEDQTRLSMGHHHFDHHYRPQHERRHTMDTSFYATQQPLPHVQSHHHRTSYPSMW